MFWIFKFLRKGGIFKRILITFIVIFIAFSSIITFILFTRYRMIAGFLINRKVDQVLEKAQNKANQIAKDTDKLLPDLEQKHNLSDAQGPTEGIRGNGINLLLIDKISAEGYIKEMFSLYRDSAQGSYDSFEYRIGMMALLGKQYNETGVYAGSSVLLKSYLPWKNKTVQWGVGERNAPPEAMKLKTFNSTAAKLAGIDKYYNQISETGTYVNVFQINEDYFNTSPKSSLNGYQATSSRKADMFFLPDSLSYLNQQYTSMINTFNVSEQDESIKAALYGIWHNGGSGTAEYFNGLGTTNTKDYVNYYPSGSMSKAIDKDKAKADWVRWLTALPNSLKIQSSKYSSDAFRSVPKGYGVAIWLLLDDGYYMTPRLYDIIKSGNGSSDNYQRDTLAAGYNAIHGTKVSGSDVPGLLLPKVKEVWEAYPSYITESQFNATYGENNGALKKGGLWKLEDETTDAYKNKVNGKNPRVLHRTNIEVAGFAYDVGYRGPQVYEDMLRLAGVDDDITNPQQYYDNKQNEFIPSAGNFATILKKIGISIDNPDVYSVLEEGYRVSGFEYRYGGKGQAVNQDNYFTIRNMPDPGDIGTKHTDVFNQIYRTKDGTSPVISINRRKDNLVNYGKQVFDCSGLVWWAFQRGYGDKAGLSLPQGTSGQGSSSLLTTIKDRSQAKVGDVFVKSGVHIYFFLGKGSGESLATSESKTENPLIARRGYSWVLEAQKTGTRVGIRTKYINFKSNDDGFTLRRFKAFM